MKALRMKHRITVSSIHSTFGVIRSMATSTPSKAATAIDSIQYMRHSEYSGWVLLQSRCGIHVPLLANDTDRCSHAMVLLNGVSKLGEFALILRSCDVFVVYPTIPGRATRP